MTSFLALQNQIMTKKSIVDYLEAKGHQPYRVLAGGKMQYLCPFPDHDEQKPSFVVWTNSEYENFYCFGCQRSYSIINLVAGLENIPFREAVERLGDGVEISLDEEMDIEMERMKKEAAKNPEQDLSMDLLSISSQCLAYSMVHPEDVDLVDKIYASVDEDLLSCFFDKIHDTSIFVGPILVKRKNKITQDEEINKVKKYKEKYNVETRS